MSITKRVLLWLLGIFFVVAGVMHFVNTDFYLRIMPDYLPLHRELVYLSGVAETVLGVLVLVPATRRLAAWGLIALLIAVFPANLHMAIHQIPMQPGEPPNPLLLYLRLPFQGVFIASRRLHRVGMVVHTARLANGNRRSSAGE